LKALYTLAAVVSVAAVLSKLLVVTPLAGAAGTRGLITDARHMALIANARRHSAFGRTEDARHMALITNARRHGVSLRFEKSIALRQLVLGSNGNRESRPRLDPRESGGLSWTYPGVLAGLSFALAFTIGGVVVASRRRFGKPHTVRG
jgi:hypothetical protein